MCVCLFVLHNWRKMPINCCGQTCGQGSAGHGEISSQAAPHFDNRVQPGAELYWTQPGAGHNLFKKTKDRCLSYVKKFCIKATLSSEMCPWRISPVMSDTHMPCFYRGCKNGAEKGKGIGSLPPRKAVINSQKALHVCLLSLKHCFMALFTWAMNFHKWVVTYIQGRSLAACFWSVPWLPSSSSLRFWAFHFLAHPCRVRQRPTSLRSICMERSPQKEGLGWIFVVGLDATLT